MEQCFRIALWMFFLIGYLQAKPVSSEKAGHCNFNMADLDFELLHEHVVCGNVNFKIQDSTNMTEHCHTAALKYFKDELEHARMNCTDEQGRINDTLDVLDMCTLPTQTNSSECKWENKGSFAEFVKALETFVQRLNNY